MFFFGFHKMQSKKSTSKDKIRKTRAIQGEKQTPCGFVLSYQSVLVV